jgi:hypothetical protein
MIYIDNAKFLATGKVQAFDSLGISQDVNVGGVVLGGKLSLPLSCFILGASSAPAPFSNIVVSWDPWGPDSVTIFAHIKLDASALKILLDWSVPNQGRKLIRMRIYGYTLAGGTVELLVQDFKLDWFIDSAMAQSGMFLMSGYDQYLLVIDIYNNSDPGWDEVQYLKGGFTARVVN